jgi:hypothetical protein
MEKNLMFFKSRIKNIHKNDKVLEIGPGNSPYSRANVFLELKYATLAEELAQKGHIKTQRNLPISPAEHIDIGSRIDGFVGQLSVFVPVTFIDIRPIPIYLSGITCRNGSITSLPYNDGEISCLSSLCVIEHIGLGQVDGLTPSKYLIETAKENILKNQEMVINKGTKNV